MNTISIVLDIICLIVLSFCIKQDYEEYKENAHYISGMKFIDMMVLLSGICSAVVISIELTWFLSGGEKSFAGGLIASFMYFGITLYRRYFIF